MALTMKLKRKQFLGNSVHLVQFLTLEDLSVTGGKATKQLLMVHICLMLTHDILV